MENRVKNVRIVKPIVYGNTAKYFGKKRDEDGHTHQWCVYLKPYKSAEDMALYVKRVQFKLHDSYQNSHRTITKPPYEIRESGWGEFEVQIKIFFIDSQEKPITIYYFLRLFQTSTTSGGGEILHDNKREAKWETYDEIVFAEPTQLMHSLLIMPTPITHHYDNDFTAESKKQNEKMRALNDSLQKEIRGLSGSIQRKHAAIKKVNEELNKAKSKIQQTVDVD